MVFQRGRPVDPLALRGTAEATNEDGPGNGEAKKFVLRQQIVHFVQVLSEKRVCYFKHHLEEQTICFNSTLDHKVNEFVTTTKSLFFIQFQAKQ